MTTQTLTLTDFLLARIAEDEEVARTPSLEVASLSARTLSEEAHNVRLAHPPLPGLAAAMEEGARLLTRYDPDRVLAECEAKRRIVGLVDSPGAEFPNFEGGYETCWEDVLHVLALPYAGHSDYREEWRP